MFRFTIRDLLWLMVVVGMGVASWIATWHAYEQEAERKLWQLRSEQLKSQVEQSGDAIVEFLPTRTSVAFGKKATKPQG